MVKPKEWTITPMQMGTAMVDELREPLRAVMADAEAAARTVKGAMDDLTRAITRFRRCQCRVERQMDSLRWLPLLLQEEGPAMPKPVPRRIATALAALARFTPRLRSEVPGDLQVLAGRGLFDIALERLLTDLRRLAEAEAPITVSARPIDARQPNGPSHPSMRITGPALLIMAAAEGSVIPSDVRPYLFRPFHPATKGPLGLGIGLWLSRRLARAHGGDLWLDESAPTATFLSVWPAASD